MEAKGFDPNVRANLTSGSFIKADDTVRYSVTVLIKGFKTTKNFKNEYDAESFCLEHELKGNKIIKKIRWHKR